MTTPQPLLLHPISFETNVNMQELELRINTSGTHVVALFVRSVLLPLFNTISSKDLKTISVVTQCEYALDTDALLNAFDQDACLQIDERLAQDNFAKLRDISIAFYEDVSTAFYEDISGMPDLQNVKFLSEIGARFPRLIDKNMLTCVIFAS
ncbi:uncharacterized protein LAESUDRAFT_58384 [Laetiporus sulphureus 93-53]|uniref:Uncharacterized protein n=1 Tax=Laetiporus sulphureus 93-53 TaxID=1314785 RepID=A0A165AZ41_9APHY|nr:uncharacterized protein LAESUDRAFT_58384 [Laetiporus sulphureus 93-53]KZS99926.1 hypothetical protein LAESUDRAFT_58384 [Laetiporus sulphureus 93-53]